MAGVRQRFVGLCVPPILFCLVDAALTLAGQPAQYWNGNRSFALEQCPAGYYLLTLHPAAFAIGTMLWVAAFVGVLLLLTDTLAVVTSIAVAFGHTACATSWLEQTSFSYQFSNGLILLCAVVVGLGIRWGWQAGPREPLKLGPLPAAWRWALVAIFCGVAVYLFLWPSSVGS